MINDLLKDCTQSSSMQESVIHQRGIISEFYQGYARMVPPLQMDQRQTQNLFRQHGIIYDSSSKYQHFSFSLDRSVPVHGFYKIQVKIAHFSLTISACRHDESNLFRDQPSIKSTSAKIYFTELNNKSLCFKSFPFDNEESFQCQFRKIVKEWSILKICSILECGPFLQNYLGFDLIIYDDCIQYVTEKGRQYLDFGPTQSRQLYQQLALMHRLHIIHYDIKPANIIFSEMYGKPVFIDFGLSQIIEEEIGFKTIGGFRGTPNYCCPEMFVLMLAEDSYIDLYYNDSFCLKLTALSLSKSQDKNYEELSLIQLGIKQQQKLLFFSLRYHYLSDEQAQVKISFERYRKKGGNIATVLQLIKAAIHYVFLADFFESNLSQFQGHFLYQEIQRERKISHEKIYFQKSVIRLKDKQSNRFIPSSFSTHEKETNCAQSNQNYPHLLSVINGINLFQEKSLWNYVAIIFTCVRFDRRNLLAHDKIAISKKVIPLLEAYRGKNHEQFLINHANNQLNQIRQLISIILELILESRPNSWSKDNLFDVCQQLCLLDVDMNIFANNLLLYIQQNYKNQLEIILAVLQCNRLKNTMFLISSNHLDKMELFHKQLDNFITIFLNEFSRQTSNSTSKQIQSIKSTLSLLNLNENCIDFISIEDEEVILQYIKHVKIRKYLLYLMTIKNISFWFVNMNSSNVLTKASFIKKCWETQKIDLLSWLQITINIMKITQSYSQLQDYINEIGKIINCEQIVNSVKIQNTHIFHFSSKIIFQKKLNKLLNSYDKLNKLSQQGDFILRQLIQQVKFDNIQIDAQIHDKLKQLYRCYEKNDAKNKKGDLHSVSFYYLTYARADIQSFFYHFSPQTRDVLLSNVRQSEIDVECKDKVCIDDQERGYRIFKYCLYQFTYNMMEYRYEQSLEHLRSFIKVCQILNIHNITLQGLKNSHQISSLTRKQDLIIDFTYKLYDHCKSTHNISFYLLPTHQLNALSALAVFARLNQKLFYEFLFSLVQFISSHPLDSYFEAFFEVLSTFLQKDSNNGYLIHYKKFSRCQSRPLSNPYFLVFYVYCLANEADAEKIRVFKIIAANVDRLSDFAKRKIMSKYFSVYLRLIRGEKFRQRFFIFRHAKLYLSQQKTISQIKNLLNRSKFGQSRIGCSQSLRSKAKQFVEICS